MSGQASGLLLRRCDVLPRLLVLFVALTLEPVVPAYGQSFAYRGFVEERTIVFPQDAPNDSRNLIADVLARTELFTRPTPWLGLAAGVDVRANSYTLVEDSWRLDIGDRGTLRPRLSVRRLTATMNRGPLTVDIGKQFIRWGKADILTPTDRFAPRDYINVIEPDFLPVRGIRAVVEQAPYTVDVVWVPLFTPSRFPLLNQRWNAAPQGVLLVSRQNDEHAFPRGSQFGMRWGQSGRGSEYSLSYYEGFNHLPSLDQRTPSSSASPGLPTVVEIVKRFPTLRMYGGDAAVTTRWFTAKGEIGYFTTSTPATDEYVLYVLQLERQTGEWTLVGGYAGEVVTERGAIRTFAPDRGTAKTFLGRVSYTIDVNRSTAFEGAVRTDSHGLYLKSEYSQSYGPDWRLTTSGALIRGEPDDFLGQYRLNSHFTLSIRYSF